MGAYNMKLVMDSLDRVPISLPESQPSGDSKDRKFDAYDLALLLTIANRQHDRTYDSNGNETNTDVNWLCYGNNETLMAISRMGKSKFADCKRFLLKLGLITYKPQEKARDMSDLGSKKMRWYNFVYRLNMEKLAEYRRQADQLADGDDLQEDETVRITEEPVRNAEEPVRITEEPVRITEEPVRITDTKITEKRDHNNTTINNISGGGDVDNDKELVNRYCELIAKGLGEDPAKIGDEGIRKCALGKNPKAIAKIILKCKAMRSRDPIGLVLSQCKLLPPMNLSREELEAQFAAVKTSQPENLSDDVKLFRASWSELCQKCSIDKLPKEQQNDLGKLYQKSFGTLRDQELSSRLKNLLEHLPCTDEMSDTDRYETVRNAITEETES